ncbi:hypothetical protein EVG20_g2936 [Dentipellis fragilis]|uniref:Uncharacterized protein n=1 Tax=Dentipellis fragilis TaxID=205917 RepID=A0A4Y9Z984_9AGAM|nr:hypothetical protein EVG20_g2936 [Dentipellis fragilis]
MPRPSKLIPSYTEADLAAPSMTMSYPYVDREGHGRATPARDQPTPAAKPPARHQYNTPTNYAALTQPTRQPQYSTAAAGSRDATYHNQRHDTAYTRGATNPTTTTTNPTNTTNTTNTNHYHERRASRQAQEAPPYLPTNPTFYNGSEPAGSSTHVAAASYERQYGATQAQHGIYGTGRHASSTQTAGPSHHGAHVSYHHSSVARTNPEPTSSSLQAHTVAMASTSSHYGQSSAAPTHPDPTSSTAIEIHPELNYEWTFPAMTTGQASYQQHPSGLAPPADYPSLSSSGAHMQPPSHTRAMGPPPAQTQRPVTGRPHSRSVQQGSIPAAGHPTTPSPRSRRISHAVPPTAADFPSYTQAPSTIATHQVGSSSIAHAPTYPVDPTASDSRGSSNSQVQQPPAGPSRTRKGKEPRSDLFTREPLQFKRPADNSRPSSFIESDDEGKNGKLKKGWRYSARDSLSIRTSAKKMKHAVTTTESTALTDAQIIAKGEALHITIIVWNKR